MVSYWAETGSQLHMYALGKCHEQGCTYTWRPSNPLPLPLGYRGDLATKAKNGGYLAG